MPIRESSTLFELLPIGAYRSKPGGEVFQVNAALIRMAGFANAGEYKRSGLSFARHFYVNRDRRAEFAALMERDEQISDFISEAYRLKTGERIWVRELAHLVRDRFGNVQFYEGTIEDITQERIALGALQRTANLLRNVLQTIPDRVWLKDVTGSYLTCNDAFASGHLGASVSDVIGSRDEQWYSQQQVIRISAHDNLAMREGRTIVTEDVMSSQRRPSQEFFEVVKTPLLHATGEIIGVLGIARSVQQRKDSEALLRDTSEQLELALMGADLGRWDYELSNSSGYRLDERSCKLLGRDTAESMVRRSWRDLVHTDDVAGVQAALTAHLGGNAPAFEAEYRMRHTDGRWIWVSTRGKVVQFSKDGAALRMVGTLSDISRRKHAEQQLHATRAELQATLHALPDLVMEFTVHGQCRAVHSQNSIDLVQTPGGSLNQYISDALPAEAAVVCMAALQEARTHGKSVGRQYSLMMPRGQQWYELSVVTKPTEPGDEERLIAIARNITERKLAEQAIEKLAFHDSLTGLPNRRMLSDRLQTAVMQSARQNRHGAVMFLDLDRFKQLNDTYGHETGDLLLQGVAGRLLQCVRGVDTVARLGGDEFVVLIQELSTDWVGAFQQAMAVGQKILSTLKEPHLINGQAHFATPSIGAVLFQGTATAPTELIKQADMAMYDAKKAGRNTIRFFDQNEL
jgi:diguanylate cyclase (GGDEF)-like protein/PAS domain S-box-containing protein